MCVNCADKPFGPWCFLAGEGLSGQRTSEQTASSYENNCLKQNSRVSLVKDDL